MYRIRLPSGTEQIYTSIQELADAVRQGSVGRDASIFHRRSGQWLPLESHPYFAYASSEAEGAEKPPADEDAAADPWATESPPPEPTPPTPPPAETKPEPRISTIGPMPPRPIKPDQPPPVLEPLIKPEPPSRVTPLGPVPPRQQPPAPLVHEPIAPTPMKLEPLPAAPPMEPEPRRRRGRAARDHVSAPEPLSVSPPRGRRAGMLIFLIVILGSAAGLLIGRKLLIRNGGPEDAVSNSAPAQPVQVPSLGGPVPDRPLAQRADPTAPVGVEELIDRRAEAFDAARARLRIMLDEAGLATILNVRALATPAGALAARRDVAASLNVIGQFRRREVMIEQAYEDSARFQTERAGWTSQAIDRWENRPVVREPYASADLAESLLADADSLLAILTAAEDGWDIRGDTLVFDDPARASAWRAQLDRIRLQAGEPVNDPAGLPTLTPVRAAVEPSVLPTAR